MTGQAYASVQAAFEFTLVHVGQQFCLKADTSSRVDS